ncbi:MAG: FHA domain-containing protein [Lachnospiraceae bacterium]|nr:FHA domain-containing protein [Lachnospiraceae bacterium]
MNENRTFYKKAGTDKLTWGDVFSDVFRKHTPEENARLFIAGTALTTPDEKNMLKNWQKPYMFARVFLCTLLVMALLYVLLFGFGHTAALPFLFMAGSFLVPITAMCFFWEMNIPRNVSFVAVIVVLLIGGLLSFVFTTIGYEILPGYMTIIVGIVEETAKVGAAAFFLRGKDKKYILTGMLIGSTIGAGFTAIEDAWYAIIQESWSFSELGGRIFWALGGHILWAAVSCGALVWAKGDEKLQMKHFTKPVFLKYFVLVIALHTIWDSLPIVSMSVILSVIIILVAFWMMKKGLNQVVAATVRANENRLTYAVGDAAGSPSFSDAETIPIDGKREELDSGFRILGVAGYFSGKRYPVKQHVRIGRDPAANDLVVPAGTSGVSGRHCEIMCQNGRVYIRDLGSSYGTFVNGTRLNPEQLYEVGVGARISLGSSTQEIQIAVRHGNV